MTTWVLLRGLAREARHWGDFSDALLQRLPRGDAVLTIDLPGTGTCWRERTPADVAGLVRAARRELARCEPRPPYTLVALSLGGMVAHQWMAQAPRSVQGCVLINTSLGGLAPFWQRLRPACYPALLALALPGVSPLQREQAILRLTSNRPAPEGLARTWAQYACSAPVSRGNALRQLLAAARYRAGPVAPQVPVLVLAARQDRLVSVECSRAIARAWGVPLREHADAGHDLPLDDPDWVIDQICRWHALQVAPALRAS